jgi:hypothetical protein
MEAEQWLRRVECAKAQAHPDNIAAIAAEVDSLVREVDTLVELAHAMPMTTTKHLMVLKDVKISLGIHRVLVHRASTKPYAEAAAAPMFV